MTVCGTFTGQVVAVEVFVSSIDDKKQPKDLVAALCEDVLPYVTVDDALPSAVGLHQQQVWGGCLSCQGCRHTHT